MCFSKTEVMEHEVFLFDLINKERAPMPHLKVLLLFLLVFILYPTFPQAVCFLRPTRDNVEALSKEISEPKYRYPLPCHWTVIFHNPTLLLLHIILLTLPFLHRTVNTTSSSPTSSPTQPSATSLRQTSTIWCSKCTSTTSTTFPNTGPSSGGFGVSEGGWMSG